PHDVRDQSLQEAMDQNWNPPDSYLQTWLFASGEYRTWEDPPARPARHRELPRLVNAKIRQDFESPDRKRTHPASVPLPEHLAPGITCRRDRAVVPHR